MSVTESVLRDGEGPIYIQSSVISRGYQLDPFRDLFGFLINGFLSPTFVTSILECVRILPCILVMSVLVNLLLPLQSGLMEYISGLEVLACSSPEIQRF